MDSRQPRGADVYRSFKQEPEVQRYKDLLEQYYQVIADKTYRTALQPIVEAMQKVWNSLYFRHRRDLLDYMVERCRQWSEEKNGRAKATDGIYPNGSDSASTAPAALNGTAGRKNASLLSG